MTRLADHPDFAAAVGAAAAELGPSAGIIEKDYWVTQALRALAGAHPDDWIFKGGTSLSKAYGLIERFSEDIDVLVMPGSRGKGACDSLMKMMARGVSIALCGGGLPPSVSAETGVHRTYDIAYRRSTERSHWLRPEIRLEMGVRGGAEPHGPRQVRPLLADARAVAGDEYEDLHPFSLQVLHPGRTLVEKLLLTHRVATAIESGEVRGAPAGFGRHLYDIHQLLGAEVVIEFLADRSEFLAVAEDAFDIGARHFGETIGRRPEASPRVPPSARLQVTRR